MDTSERTNDLLETPFYCIRCPIQIAMLLQGSEQTTIQWQNATRRTLTHLRRIDFLDPN